MTLFDVASSDMPSNKVLTDVINAIAKRENYGLSQLSNASAAIWRWEVQDLTLLPEDFQPLFVTRRSRREQARTDLATMTAGMTQEEVEQLFSKKRKAEQQDVPVVATPSAPSTAQKVCGVTSKCSE